MKNHYAIITTGTSIYSPSNIFHELRKQNIVDYKHWQKNIEELKTQGKVNISNISAEMNVLNSLKVEGEWKELYCVTLIHSDTVAGLSAAVGLKTCISEFFNVEIDSILLKKIPGLDMNSKSDFLISMTDLVEVLSDLFGKDYLAVKDETLFIPIGGYKSVTMISHLLGDLHGFKSWYQHEDSKHVFAIPQIPVKVDDSIYTKEPLIGAIKTLFCAENYSFEDFTDFEILTNEEKSIIRDNSYLFYPIGDEIAISPMVVGKLKEVQNKTGSYLPDVFIREKVNDKNNLKMFIKYFLKYWRRYSQSPNEYIDTMHHEFKIKSFPKNDTKGLCRFTINRIPFRGIYHISNNRKAIYFDKIWFNHDDYDRVLNSTAVKQVFMEQVNTYNYQKLSQEQFINLNLFED